MIKVMLVDDHKLIRKGVISLLNSAPDIHVIAEASSGEEAIELIKTSDPDIVLMDLDMPGMGGMEATRNILKIKPKCRILILTVCDNDLFPARLLEEGAFGYITKDTHPDEMIQAIRMVSQGDHYISPLVAQKLALRNCSGKKQDAVFDHLSEREFQVMLMITKGKKAPEIAKSLNLSTKTINTYRYRLFEKLKVNSDVELTHLALRHGVIETNH